MTISTPPLSPRRDINIMSPSPLRISDDTHDSSDKDRPRDETSEEDKENAHGTSDKNAGGSEQPAGSLSAADVKTALLAMSVEDLGANAVAGEVEMEAEAETGVEKGGSSAGVAKGGGGGGCQYVSPSDALMSPCTQQLNALKGKKIARGGESGVRRLFGDRIGKKEDKGGDADDEGGR